MEEGAAWDSNFVFDSFGSSYYYAVPKDWIEVSKPRLDISLHGQILGIWVGEMFFMQELAGSFKTVKMRRGTFENGWINVIDPVTWLWLPR